jgi:hypothetical protein
VTEYEPVLDGLSYVHERVIRECTRDGRLASWRLALREVAGVTGYLRRRGADACEEGSPEYENDLDGRAYVWMEAEKPDPKPPSDGESTALLAEGSVQWVKCTTARCREVQDERRCLAG